MMPLPRKLAASPARAVVLLLGLGAAAGCDPYPTLKDVPVDCTVEDGYEFLILSTFDNVGDNVFWGSGDNTIGKVVGDDENGQVFVQSIPDGSRCGSNAAAVLRAAHNNDWGCLFGSNNLGGPRDAHEYEGMSFWARAPGNTTKSFVLLLNDPNTAVFTGVESNCIDMGADATNAAGNITITVDGQSVSTSGSVTRPTFPNECGNGYSAVMLVTSEWAFYTIPFSRFQQDPKPNRVPNDMLTKVGTAPGTALLTDQLLTLILRMPKEAIAELWIDNLGFYRKKAM